MWGPFTGPKMDIFDLRKLPKMAQAGTKIFFLENSAMDRNGIACLSYRKHIGESKKHSGRFVILCDPSYLMV